MSWASWILEPPSWFGLKGNTSVIQFTHELGILGQTSQPIGYFIPKDGIGRAGFSLHTCQSTYPQVHMLLVELDGDFFPTLGPWSDPELLFPLTTAEEMDEGVWWFAFSSGTDTKFAESAWTPTARTSNATMIGSRRILGILAKHKRDSVCSVAKWVKECARVTTKHPTKSFQVSSGHHRAYQLNVPKCT